jgi:hypothetical protein
MSCAIYSVEINLFLISNERFKLFNSFWGRDERIFNISRENKPFEIDAA